MRCQLRVCDTMVSILCLIMPVMLHHTTKFRSLTRHILPIMLLDRASIMHALLLQSETECRGSHIGNYVLRHCYITTVA
jgi:hypothetical protein